MSAVISSPDRHVAKALDAISAEFSPIELSPIYESVAVGFDGDNFINLVVGFNTERSLQEIDHTLNEIEKSCGRNRGEERFYFTNHGSGFVDIW